MEVDPSEVELTNDEEDHGALRWPHCWPMAPRMSLIWTAKAKKQYRASNF